MDWNQKSNVNSSIRKSWASGQKLRDSEAEKRRQQEENARYAQQELEKFEALKSGGKQNPDGSITPKKPSFLDYLNPIGEHGLFGKRNTAQVAHTAGEMGDWTRKKVDEAIGEEGNDKFDSVKDVARFGANLLPGMVEGFASSGKNFQEMTSGKRMDLDENGEWTGGEEDLSFKQRAAAGVVGTLDTVGIGLGGTGKFVKEIFKKPLDNALKSTVKETGDKVAKDVTKTTAYKVGREVGETTRRSAVEAGEEVLQSVASDIQDDDKLSEDWMQNAAKSAALGFAAGGMFDVAGRAIGAGKNAAKTAQVNMATGTTPEQRAKGAIETAEDATKAETTTSPTSTISPEKAERLVRIDTQLNERLTSINQQIKAIQEGTEPSVRRVIADDGTDVTAVAEKYDADVQKLESQIRDLQAQAEGVDNNTGEATIPEGVDPSEYTGDVEGRAKAAEKVPELRQQIEDLRAEQAEKFEMLGGVSDVIDTDAAKTKMKELRSEKAEALDWKIRNNIGETSTSIKQKIEDIDNGIISDELVEIREQVDSVEAAVQMAEETDTSDVSQIQRAAVVNQLHREAANNKMETLWTQEKADAFEAEYDENYHLRVEEIKQMPGPKQKAEMEMLDAEYIEVLDDNRARVQEDMDEVVAVEQALQIADDIDTRIVDRANDILESNPTVFGRVDDEAVAEVRTGLEVARTLKKAEEAPETVSPIESEDAVKQSVRNAADVEEATTIINEDPRLSEEASVIIADQVQAGNLKGGFRDHTLTTMRDGLLKMTNGDKVVQALDTAIMESAKSDNRMTQQAKADKWKLSWKNEATTDQSIAYWDRGEPLTRMEGESKASFEQRQASVDSVKSWLREKAEEQGLSPEQMVSNYFPHNFQQQFGKGFDATAEAIARLESGVNKNGKKLTEKQRNMLQRQLEGIDLGTRQMIEKASIYKVGKNGHLEKRQGAEGWSKDIPFVLDMYQRMSNKTTHMQPALDSIKSMTTDLKGTQLHFLEDALDAVTGKKTRGDERIGEKGTKAISGARRLSNVALMGASARTVALQPFSIINNWREAPNTRQFIMSTMQSMRALKPSNATRTDPVVREFLEAGGMEGSFSASLKTSKMTKVENAMMGGISLIDRTMRLGAYDMGKADYAKKLGKDLDKLTPAEYDAAKAAGVKMARQAQFGVGPMDIPLAQSSEVGKMIFQLQQFNIKQFGQEVGYIIGDKNGSLIKIDKDSDGKIVSAKLTKQGAKNLVKTIAGYSAMYALYTQIAMPGDEEGDSKNPFGFDVQDILPFGEQITAMLEFATTGEIKDEVQVPIPPVISALVGRGGSDKGVVGHVYAALTGGEDVDSDRELAGAMKSAIRNFLPGGTQGVRTFEGAKAISQGESKNLTGSTRFLVDNDSGWNIMKGLVGGQYATTEGQEWLRNGMNTIKKNQTVELSDGSKMPVSEYVRTAIQDPEEKAAWIGYYATKQNAEKQLKDNNMSRDDKLKEVRLRLTSGQISQGQASAELERYNETVRELYRPYYETIQKFPPRLANDFLEDVLINPNGSKPIKHREMDEEKVETLRSWEEHESYGHESY